LSKPFISLPPEITNARDAYKYKVASVTIRGGSDKRVTKSPLIKPRRDPKSIVSKAASQGFILNPTASVPNITEQSDRTLPTDKSIPPEPPIIKGV
jgi:hypothetical protein